MSIDGAGAGANHGFSVSCGRKCKANVRPKSCAAPNRLARYARTRIHSQARIQNPMILYEFGHFAGTAVQQARSLEINPLRQGAVLPQQLHRPGNAAALERPARSIQADFQFVAAVPRFFRELERGSNLPLVAGPRPRIEKVAVPSIGSNQHVLGTLAMRMAIESGVTNNRIQQATGG